MNRAGNLMERICTPQNLELAFRKASRGKSNRADVIEFSSNLHTELSAIADDLAEGYYVLGRPKTFTIYDPKKRLIVAAPFRDRVAFHAVMNICHDRFEKYQVFDSYASRIGKGTYAALDRARFFAARYPWFLKLDVVHYFDSINHNVMKRQLSGLFKDSFVLSFFSDVIDSSEGEIGLPIGNLTSQYFANHYLAVADHYMKEVVGVGPMVRYMDDVLIFGKTSEELTYDFECYRDFLDDKLRLSLHTPVINKISVGIPFLGYVVYPRRLRLAGKSVKRFRRKIMDLQGEFIGGMVSDEEYQQRLQSLFSFTMKADSISIRRKIVEEMFSF